jgi:hypothetical protein
MYPSFRKIGSATVIDMGSAMAHYSTILTRQGIPMTKRLAKLVQSIRAMIKEGRTFMERPVLYSAQGAYRVGILRQRVLLLMATNDSDGALADILTASEAVTLANALLDAAKPLLARPYPMSVNASSEPTGMVPPATRHDGTAAPAAADPLPSLLFVIELVDGHRCEVWRVFGEGGKKQCRCECGAVWSHAVPAVDGVIIATHAAHVAGFNAKTVTL